MTTELIVFCYPERELAGGSHEAEGGETFGVLEEIVDFDSALTKAVEPGLGFQFGRLGSADLIAELVHLELEILAGRIVGIRLEALVAEGLQGGQTLLGLADLFGFAHGPLGVLAAAGVEIVGRAVRRIDGGDGVVVARLEIVDDVLTEDGEGVDKAGQVVVAANLSDRNNDDVSEKKERTNNCIRRITNGPSGLVP